LSKDIKDQMAVVQDPEGPQRTPGPCIVARTLTLTWVGKGPVQGFEQKNSRMQLVYSKDPSQAL
jgi:hypothetical protein